jgi:hypothetical protein
MDYTIFYKESFTGGVVNIDTQYDIFFSAYDNCERTKEIFNSIKSDRKLWLNFPHYHNGDIATEAEVFSSNEYKEDNFFVEFFSNTTVDFSSKICIDITGFIRPHLIYLIKYLHVMGAKKIDFLYTEPHSYKDAEETTFSGFIEEVRLIEGCGSMNPVTDTDNDLLIITAGYDDKLIAKVAQSKSKIKKKQHIIGFPSLQPDFYQESVLKIHHASESMGEISKKFAPAFDPFVTAQVIDSIIRETEPNSNIYLSPLSTKPQTLGIALYYLWNFDKKSISILFPFSKTYNAKTAIGIKKTWKYTVELP